VYFYSWTHDINNKNLLELKESARRYNIKINYLGINSFKSVDMKIKLLYDQLCTLDDNKIVCAVDGFDVFICAGADEIKQRFLSFNCDCVISAERAYSHQYEKYKDFYDKIDCKSPYRYVNSGSIIGYVGALKKIYAPTFATILLPKIFSVIRKVKIKFNLNFIPGFYYFDQKRIGEYVAKNPENLKVRLDHDTKIFWCCAWEWEDIDNHFKVENAKIINSHTNNAPLIIHVPGWRKHRDVLTKLFKIQESLGK